MLFNVFLDLLAVLAAAVIIFIIALAASLLWTPYPIKDKTADFTMDEPAGFYPHNWIVRQFGKWVAIVCFGIPNWVFGRLVVEGLENLSGLGNGVRVVLASNHTSRADTVMIQLFLWFKGFRSFVENLIYVIGSKYFNRDKFLSRMLLSAGRINIVPPDMIEGRSPEEQRVIARILKECLKALKAQINQHGLMLFPEGARALDGQMKRIQSGAAGLIRCADTVVPIGIRAAQKGVWSTSKPPRWPLFGRDVKVVIGPPRPVNWLDQESRRLAREYGIPPSQAFVDLVGKAIAELVPEHGGIYNQHLEQIWKQDRERRNEPQEG